MNPSLLRRLPRFPAYATPLDKLAWWALRATRLRIVPDSGILPRLL